jgi:succinate dehydrogenase / fumarate reductase cytochrome b subunit
MVDLRITPTGGGTVTPVANPTLVTGSRSTHSTIALKMLMAVSGLIFIGYLFLHMYGNTKVFAGHDAFNEYAHHLRTIGEPMLPHTGLLWIVRVVLIVSVVAHVYAAIVLTRRAHKARTTKYVVKKNKGSSLASRTMRWGGLTLFLFIIWHLLNFTIGKVNPTGGATNDPYNLVVDNFGTWWITLIYLAALFALGMHLLHGVWSACQTLGLTNSARSRARAKDAGLLVAIVIAGGFALVPLSVLFGIVEK